MSSVGPALRAPGKLPLLLKIPLVFFMLYGFASLYVTKLLLSTIDLLMNNVVAPESTRALTCTFFL